MRQLLILTRPWEGAVNPLVPTAGDVFMLVAGAVAIVLWAVAVWSLSKNRSYTPGQRLLWLLLVLFAPVLGPVLWLTVGRQMRAPAAR